ncbi:MAG TPA: aminodeoxychorismate synthase component I [Pseudonocardia sp.]|nr:aminodeoxychorismate synthase component I [Pseudonocardia sp.]
MPARLLAVPLDLEVSVADAVRRLAHRTRLTAWSGAWSCGALLTCDPSRVAGAGADPFALLAEQPAVQPQPGHPDAVGGGWFGHLAFPATLPGPFPRFSLAWYPDLLRHDGSRWWYEALIGAGLDEGRARARCRELAHDLATPAPPAAARLEVTGRPDRTGHVVGVERCVQAIRCGEIYQANIACHLDLRLHGSAAEAFARIVEAHAPARAGLVADPAGTAVSASPELFLHRRGRRVRTAPIKGTRPRTGGADDAGERRRLLDSAKDAAENVMIVDLMRNDLSRVCLPGTVRVPSLLDVEAHAGVWHLVSTVEGRLAPGRDDADLLAATFPPGSVTGAPKVRAVQVIEELEAAPRGLFTGALGYAGPLAGLELAVAIRTLEVGPDGRARLGVGGGVTVESTPVEEWAECLTKAAPVLRCLGAEPAEPGRPVPRLARPEAGIFETLRAVDGRAWRLADHLARLRASYAECYGRPLTAQVAAAVAAALAGRGGTDRVRVDAGPTDPGRVRVRVTPAAPPVPLAAQPGLVLRAHRLGPAGAERHKFVDRAWIDALEAGSAPGEAVLLVDDRGRLLESTRSSVVVVRAGVAAVPPLDGRILPGIGRRAVLDALDTAGLPYELAAPVLGDLPVAEGMFLVNALRGVQWVRAAGAARWVAPDPLTRRLAAALVPTA